MSPKPIPLLHILEHRGLGLTLTAVALWQTSLIVHYAGGVPSAYVNLFYIPIVFAGLLYKITGGAIVAILAAALIKFVVPNEALLAWEFRLGVYISIGMLVGWFSQCLQQQLAELDAATTKLKLSLAQTVQAFVKAIDAKHHYTANHSQRVAVIAVLIARSMHLPENEVLRIEWAARLHDVGKLGISDSMLDKAESLSPAEWQAIRRHSINSERIVSELTEFNDLLPAIRGHHERWDGTGYPDGLKGTAIHPWARIIALADAWDAMTTNRAYRSAIPPADAVEKIKRASGNQFDPQVVEAFLAVYPYLSLPSYAQNQRQKATVEAG